MYVCVMDGVLTGLSPPLHSSDMRVACSDSNGCVSVLSLVEAGLKTTAQWKAHDFEAWITAFSYWDTQLVYSGNPPLTPVSLTLRSGVG